MSYLIMDRRSPLLFSSLLFSSFHLRMPSIVTAGPSFLPSGPAPPPPSSPCEAVIWDDKFRACVAPLPPSLFFHCLSPPTNLKFSQGASLPFVCLAGKAEEEGALSFSILYLEKERLCAQIHSYEEEEERKTLAR